MTGDLTPRRTARRWRRTAAAVVLPLLVVLAGCTGGSGDASGGGTAEGSATPTPSASPTPVPPPPGPTVGSCRRMSYDAALAPTDESEVVPCEQRHAAQTYAVGQLDTVVRGHLVAVDSARVQQQVAEACPRFLPEFLGTTREALDLTMVRPVWFTPTVEESDQGANWYRCDVVVVSREGELAPIEGRGLRGALADEAALAEYGICSTAEPGTEGFTHLLCRNEHSWRAVERVDLSGLSEGGRYPGAEAVEDAGTEPCQAAGREVAEDPLDYRWAFEWPTEEQWRDGQTFGRCWVPD